MFEGTYIFCPQWHKVTPAKSCTAFLAGRFPSFRESRSWLHCFQSSSLMMGSTCEKTHSSSGLSFTFFLLPRLLRWLAAVLPLAVWSGMGGWAGVGGESVRA